jgi:hypothetical protein
LVILSPSGGWRNVPIVELHWTTFVAAFLK